MNRTNIKALLTLVLGSALLSGTCAFAQNMTSATNAATTNAPRRGGRPATETTPQAPEVLPGNGLAQHDFFYAGENSGHLNLYIIRKGKLDWSYTHPVNRGEISDAMLLSNGNILFARQFGVTLVSPDKKVLWNYDAEPGTEIHTAQAIGKDHVLFIQNGNPAMLKVVNIVTGETNREFELPVRGTNRNQVHTQFRHARLTAAGTVLVGHMDLGKICEYDSNGKQIASWDSPSPWTVAELKNGNLLVTCESSFVREITRAGDTVWQFRKTDLPEIKIANMQYATRLSNGNTIINSWRTKGNGTAVQAFEVTSDKKFVWGLRSWNDPDLGPSTTLQVLDEPSAPENVHFGDIK